MPFLYFMPHCNTISQAEIERRDLGYVLDSFERKSYLNLSRGPGAANGYLFCDARMPEGKCKYIPDQQEWVSMADREQGAEAWVGFWKDSPPKPETLQRSSMLAGSRVLLADGNQWQIPMARKWEQDESWLTNPKDMMPRFTSEIEQSLIYRLRDGKAGWYYGGPVKKYQSLWSMAELLGFYLCDDNGASIENFPVDMDIATAVLQANYAIGKWEASLLGLFTSKNCETVLKQFIDYDSLVELVKKKAIVLANGQGSLGGQEV
jgi:hypothetical protein